MCEKCENLPRINSTKYETQNIFSKTSTPQDYIGVFLVVDLSDLFRGYPSAHNGGEYTLGNQVFHLEPYSVRSGNIV